MSDVPLRIDTLNHPTIILRQPMTVQMAESDGQVMVGVPQLDISAIAGTRTEAIVQFCDSLTAAYEQGDSRVRAWLDRFLRPPAAEVPVATAAAPAPDGGIPVYVLTTKENEVKAVTRDAAWAERWKTWAGGGVVELELDKLP